MFIKISLLPKKYQFIYFKDFYKRKRLRLQIHPGLIAAPLAGLAAFGAASALTSKPLLVELGYVRNKPDHIIGGGGGGIPGGWGWAGTQGHGYRPYPPFYPPPNPPPPIHQGILLPELFEREYAFETI